MQSIDFLIPTRTDVASCMRVIREISSNELRSNDRIIVSVSDPKQFPKFAMALSEFEFVRLLPPDSDLSLYQNFRRLINEATGDLVTICADDDYKPVEFASVARSLSPQASLGIPDVELSIYDRTHRRFGSERHKVKKFGSGRLAKAGAIIAPHPTWVFGVWRRDWLAKHFPNTDFDWLDCALIQRAILDGVATRLSPTPSIICGYDPDRSPWSVSETGHHSLSGWDEYCSTWIVDCNIGYRALWRYAVVPNFQRTMRALNNSHELGSAR